MESFGIDNSSDNEHSLRKRLFGSQKSSSKQQRNSQKHRSPPRGKNLISRIFPSIGLDERAASTESLPATSYSEENSASCGRRRWLLPRRSVEERLHLNDRTKSASTGELSGGADRTDADDGGSLQRFLNANETHGSNGLLSVPQTPLWGGSTESMASSRLNCPLLKKTGCSELLTPGTILEHLSGSHPGPMIHFHRGKATLPVPYPFSSEGIYVLHQGGDIFFLQVNHQSINQSINQSIIIINLQLEKEEISIAGTGVSGNKWGWILNIRDDHGMEVIFRRDVINLLESVNASPLNVAILPENLCVTTIEISLLEYRSNEGIQV